MRPETKCKENFQIVGLCNIYNLSNYVCVYYLGSERETLIELLLGSGGSYKHVNKSYDNVLGIGNPDLLMYLMSCHGFLKKNDYVVILKCPNRMFEYYFNKGFIIFDCDKKYLERLSSEIKYIIGTEVTDNSDKVMIFSTTFPSTSNTLKNLLVNASSHYSYTKKEFNNKNEDKINIFSAYVAPQIKEIYHPALIQEWRLNIDAEV